MGNPEIPHPRRPRTPLLNTALGALATLGDIYNETRGATNAAIDATFAAIDFNEDPFTSADVFRRMNPQYSAPKSAAGQGPKQVIPYFEKHGFLKETKTKRDYVRIRHLEVGTRLIALAEGLNELHLKLIQTCQGENPLEKETLLALALKTYAVGNRQATTGATVENLAKQTKRHPQTVIHLGLIGFTGSAGMAASVKTLRSRWIKDTGETRRLAAIARSVQPERGLQPVAPGELVTA